MKRSTLILSSLLILGLAVACVKQSLQATYDKQTSYIDNFVATQMKADTNATLKQMAKEAKTTEDAVMEDLRNTMLHSKVGGFLLKNAAWSGDGAEALRKHMGAEPDEPADKKA